ncbi:MAG: glycosyltransferase [Ferrimicrobium sp.]
MTSAVVVVLVDPSHPRGVVRKATSALTPSSYRVVEWVVGSPAPASVVGIVDRAELVAVVDVHGVVASGWLEALIAAYNGGAVVSRSPNVCGPQRMVLKEGHHVYSASDQRAFASTQRAVRRGLVTSGTGAADLVALVPTSWLRPLLGLAGLSRLEVFRSLLEGRALRIAHDSIVFSSEVKSTVIPTVLTEGDPLLSACLIAKDEESTIAEAIDSVIEVVDEVIVYDTGSTDATVAIATDRGARVVRGEWRGDFSWARNQALSYCRGSWILWIDADERLRGDLEGLRDRLLDPQIEIEAFSVSIENAVGSGLGAPTVHFASRLFRRADCKWRGALHESIWARDLQRTAYTRAIDGVSLYHIGYLDSEMARKGKSERNLSISEHNETAASDVESAVHQARSLMLTGNFEGALAIIEARGLDPQQPGYYRLALRVGIDCLRRIGRFDDAHLWLDRLTDSGIDRAFVSEARGLVYLDQIDYRSALAEFESVGEVVVDPDGWVVRPESLVGFKASALAGLERFKEAAETCLAALNKGVLDVHLGVLISWMRAGSVPMDQLASALDGDKEQLVVAQLLQLVPSDGDEILEELVAIRPHDRTLLAAASLVALRLSISRSVVWSRRLIEQELTDSIPLIKISMNPMHVPERRFEAAVAGWSIAGLDALERAAAELAELVSSQWREQCYETWGCPPSLRTRTDAAKAVIGICS